MSGRIALAVFLAIVAMNPACQKPAMTASRGHVVACRRIRERLRERFAVDLRARRNEGLTQAEAFRLDLVKKGHDVLLAESILRFRRFVEAAKLLAGRPGIDGFKGLTETGIAEAIRGTGGQGIDGEGAFGKFTGRWFGHWRTMKVDHSWDEIDRSPPPFGPQNGPRPLSMQFAWVGDAFCWHTVAACPRTPAGHVILGTVYHITDGKIQPPVPHVAIAVPPGRLVWITPSHVFFEEVTPDERYVITGFAYTTRSGRLRITGRQAFQAVYTRSPDHRPPFFTFEVDLGD